MHAISSKIAVFAYTLLLSLASPCLLADNTEEGIDKTRLSDTEIAEILFTRARAIRLSEVNGIPLDCSVGYDLISLIGIDEAKESCTIDFNFLITTCGAIENVVVAGFSHIGRADLSHKIDRYCRWLIPSIYGFLSLWDLLFYR